MVAAGNQHRNVVDDVGQRLEELGTPLVIRGAIGHAVAGVENKRGIMLFEVHGDRSVPVRVGPRIAVNNKGRAFGLFGPRAKGRRLRRVIALPFSVVLYAAVVERVGPKVR